MKKNDEKLLDTMYDMVIDKVAKKYGVKINSKKERERFILALATLEVTKKEQ